MKKTVSVELTIPEGYEYTGEYRQALPREWYLTRHSATRAVFGTTLNHFILKLKPKKNLSISVPLIDGFRYTGEYRAAKPGEWWLSATMLEDVGCGETPDRRLILEKVD